MGRIAATLGLAMTMAAAVLLAPIAAGSPETDAYDAITAAWEAAGGDDSVLGAPDGDVYSIGQGFAQDFAGGKMFFTPETGARAMYGAVLDKYESLGGPAGSGLGFPNIDEVSGLAGPDSRVTTFSAGDRPVIFWTPDHGAFVVRGAINAAWDRLGSSGGALGVPVEDATDDGGAVSQKFSGGQVSWSTTTKAFTTVPPELAAQLADMQVPVDPALAIDRSWQATGGASGPLGAKQGGQYPIGNDGVGQDFAGGKIFFTSTTGANAIEGDILAKYESLGGPVGSDLGFPVTNETDGGIAPSSRISTFSGADNPVIFWTPDHGAFVVRGAMKAAWDKLGGPTGTLAAPAGDQTVDARVVTQEFTGGKISWNSATNTFSTEPPNLASSLSGLRVPGQNAPSGPSGPASAVGTGHGSGSHWWWLAVVVGVLLVVGMLAWAALWRQRRRTANRAVTHADQDAVTDHEAVPVDDEGWPADTEIDDHYVESVDQPLSDEAELDEPALGTAWLPDDDISRDDLDAENPDDVDTAPTRIPSDAEVTGGRHAAVNTADAEALSAGLQDSSAAHPVIHLPLDDPYQAPEGFPVKAIAHSGLYCTPDSALYEDTLAEIWFASEEVALANGFIKAG